MTTAKIAAGTKVASIWGRPADPHEDPEVLRHAKNGVWVMRRDTDKAKIVITKERFPLHALAFVEKVADD